MRTIKFRAKDYIKSRKDWMYGYIAELDDVEGIWMSRPQKWMNYPKVTNAAIRVIPETVGQFTGLYDKNLKKHWRMCQMMQKCILMMVVVLL